MDLVSRVTKSVAFLLLWLLLFSIPHPLSASPPLKRILILFPYESHMPGFIDFESGLRSTLAASKDFEFEFYVECMDLTRFPDERYQEKLMELYREKYSSLKIDLIVANQLPSLKFLAEYSPASFHKLPVLLYAQDPRFTGEQSLAPDAITVTGKLDMSDTLALAMRLHPNVRKVFVVSGASRLDKSLEAAAREELRSFESRVELCYLSGLPIDELTRRLSCLPEGSLTLYLAVFQDGNGRTFKSPEALALISKEANAPIYSLSDSYIDSGIVGGRLISHSALGAKAASTALRILGGEKPDDWSSSEESVNQYVFDAHQLRRWGISEDSLPRGSDIRHRSDSAWEEYRWRIIGVLSLLFIQALLISALVSTLQRQRRADRALQKAADEWQTTFDSINDMIMLMDHEFRILRVNAAASSFTALPLEEIRGKSCHSILHGISARPEDCPCAVMSRTKKHEEAVLYDEKRDAWLFVSVDPILDDRGELTGLVHAVKDVTEKKRAMEALAASEEFNRAVLASLKNHIAILDKNGTILAVNEAWEQHAIQNDSQGLAGLGPGANYLEICQAAIQTRAHLAWEAFNGIRSVIDGERDSYTLEYPCDSPDESRWFFMKVMPFRNPEGGVVISHTDITERKNAELEAQLRREELTHVTRIVTIGELAASLAHEINQPITAILCNAEAAQRFLSRTTPDLEEVRTILADIIQDDKRAGEVIRRMRTLVKKETPQREPLNLNDAVRETIALVRNASFLGGVSIVDELDPELPVVPADRVQLQQVVMNLLLNATAAMKKTPPALRKLVITTGMRDGRGVMVSVRDSGAGIAANDAERLFEPFYTTKRDGLGMGLPISRTIIKAHGGTIWAENHEEGGAVFHFTLPLDLRKQPQGGA